jgi:hypothetical protein
MIAPTPEGDTLIRPPESVIDPFEGDPGDPEHHAHLVAVEQGQSAVALVDHAIATGTEIPMCKACSKALAGLD